MWLKRSGWQCIQSRKKSHCSNGDGREPGCFNIVYSQMCSTHKKKKKVLWNFLLISSKNISLFTSLGSDSRSQAHKTFVRFFFFWQKFEKVCKILWNSGRCCTSSEGNCSFFFLFFFFGVLECERPEGADVEKMTFTSMSRDRRQRCTLNAYCFFALKTFPLPARSCPDPAPTETFVQTPVTKSSCLSSRVWESGIVKTEQIPRVPKQTRCLFCWLYGHADVISFYSL